MKGLLLALLLGALVPAIHAQQQDIQQIAAEAATGSSLAVVVDEVPLVHTTLLLPMNRKGQLVGKAGWTSR